MTDTATGCSAVSASTIVTFIPVPTITSISPVSGPFGINVTITGSELSTTPEDNLVLFRAIQATVTGATATQLIVTVPAGATYVPVSVKVGGPTGYSYQHFLPTFTPGKPTITTSDFDPIVNFTPGFSPRGITSGDLNGDGKPDIVVANFISNNIYIYQNTATIGSISSSSFASPLIITAAGTNPGPGNVAIGDLDGDGKLDMAVTNNNTNTVSFFRNTTTSGTISYASPITLATGSNPYHLAIRDLNLDGKPC